MNIILQKIYKLHQPIVLYEFTQDIVSANQTWVTLSKSTKNKSELTVQWKNRARIHRLAHSCIYYVL